MEDAALVGTFAWLLARLRAVGGLLGGVDACCAVVVRAGPGSATLHCCRSICRRAERSVVPLVQNGQVAKQPPRLAHVCNAAGGRATETDACM